MFFALPPDMTPSLPHLGLGLLFLSPLAVTFPWTLQPGGRGLLPLVPPPAFLPGAAGLISRMIVPCGLWPLLVVLARMIQSGVRRVLLLDPTRMIQSGASGRRLSRVDPVRVAAAPPACSVPDDPVHHLPPPRMLTTAGSQRWSA